MTNDESLATWLLEYQMSTEINDLAVKLANCVTRDHLDQVVSGLMREIETREVIKSLATKDDILHMVQSMQNYCLWICVWLVCAMAITDCLMLEFFLHAK